jgi:hypothetical protein
MRLPENLITTKGSTFIRCSVRASPVVPPPPFETGVLQLEIERPLACGNLVSLRIAASLIRAGQRDLVEPNLDFGRHTVVVTHPAYLPTIGHRYCYRILR